MIPALTPKSWLAKPKRLQNPCSPIPSGKEIYLTELMAEQGLSTRQMRLSNFVQSQAVVSYVTNQEVFEDPVLSQILIKTILGGYMNDTLFPNVKKIKPMKHPYLNMHAKDIFDIVPVEPIDVPIANNWVKYNLCKLSVNFESLDYPIEQAYSLSDDYNPNFIKWDGKATSSKISAATGWYEFIEAPFVGVPALYGLWKNQPLSYLTATIYHVKREQLFGPNNDLAILSPVYSYMGQVNSVPFGSCSSEKLMLDNTEYQPWRDAFGNLFYNVRFNLIYSDWGWNSSINQIGGITPYRYVVGGGKAWTPLNFKLLFSLLNPL